MKDEPDAVSALTLALRDPGGDLTQGFTASTNTSWPLIAHGRAGHRRRVRAWSLNRFGIIAACPWWGRGAGCRITGSGWVPRLTRGEAFQPLRVVRRVFLILFLLLVLASLVILLFSILQVIWRRRLTEAELKARQLGQYKLVGKDRRRRHGCGLQGAARVAPPGNGDQTIVAGQGRPRRHCALRAGGALDLSAHASEHDPGL